MRSNQIRLGGYKKDESFRCICCIRLYKVIYSENNNNDFIGYEAKNGPIKIIIEEIKLSFLSILFLRFSIPSLSEHL